MLRRRLFIKILRQIGEQLLDLRDAGFLACCREIARNPLRSAAVHGRAAERFRRDELAGGRFDDAGPVMNIWLVPLTMKRLKSVRGR